MQVTINSVIGSRAGDGWTTIINLPHILLHEEITYCFYPNAFFW